MTKLGKFVCGFLGTLVLIGLGFGFIFGGIKLIDAFGLYGLIGSLVVLAAFSGLVWALSPDNIGGKGEADK